MGAETEDSRPRAVDVFAIENPVVAVLARQRELSCDGLAVALDEVVATRVSRDLIGPETMRVRHSAARRLDPAGGGFAVRPQVVGEGRSGAQNESGGETETHGSLFFGSARGVSPNACVTANNVLINLPIGNLYVLKIQAVYALIDWLAARSGGYEKAWFWDILSRPTTSTSPGTRKVLEATRARLSELVQGKEATIADLRNYLVSALGIDEVAAEALLWEPPRSLLLEAVPTLVRRLFRRWQLAFPARNGTLDLQIDYHPLPDFVPRSLFSDLSLPEVRVILPPATVRHEERTEAYAGPPSAEPTRTGRVTRRFAHERGALSHWVPVDPAFPVQDRRISDYAEEHEFVGTFTGRLNDEVDNQAPARFSALDGAALKGRTQRRAPEQQRATHLAYGHRRQR